MAHPHTGYKTLMNNIERTTTSLSAGLKIGHNIRLSVVVTEEKRLKISNLHRKEPSRVHIVETEECSLLSVDEDDQLGLL